MSWARELVKSTIKLIPFAHHKKKKKLIPFEFCMEEGKGDKEVMCRELRGERSHEMWSRVGGRL